MRVALLSRSAHPFHPPGGLERAVFDLARHLQVKGVETILVTRPPVLSAPEEDTFPGQVVTVPYRSFPGLPHGRVLDRVLFYPGFARRSGQAAARLVREGRADLVHAQGLTALGYARERQRDRGLRAPLVMNPQGMEEHKAVGLKGLVLAPLRALSREAAALSDRVIATDEATRGEVRALLRVSDARIVVLPNGLDLAALRATTPRDPRAVVEAALGATVAQAPFLLLSVGRLETYKGTLDSLQALTRLEAKGALPPGWSFVIAGEGPLAAAVDKAAAPLLPHVVRTGRVDDTLLHALYERSDVFVHATRYEGSSLVTLEAMAHARPVVATRAGGIPDKVVPGQTGWLVEPGDVAALAAAIGESAADAARRARYGRAGLERLEERFLWPVIATRTVALYEELLAGEGGVTATAADPERGESRLRRALEVGLGILGLELLFVVVSGGASLLDPGGAPSLSPAGFALRATLFAVTLLLRYGALASGRADRARLLLVLLALPALAQFHFGGGRLGGDGISYYVYVRSLVKDGDLDFTNEYTHYGWIDRADIRVPTVTGKRRSIFSVGPGLVSVPFFLAGEAVGRVRAAAGPAVDLSGYGDVHVHAVGLSGFLLGFAAVLLTHALLRRHFREGPALLAALLLWLATFLHWYMTQQPIVSHAASAAAAALILLVWDRGRSSRPAGGYLGLGVLLGLAMCLRWQTGVFLLLPALELLRRFRGEGLPLAMALRRGGLLAAGTLVGALPQMLAWKTLYGVFLLPAPPHGSDFLRLDHPYVLHTLFSSRHGLLSWTPVLWAGFLGFLPLLKRRPALALPLLPPLLVMTYVNMCSGDWWAGGSFSNRRFDSLLPVLALGTAATLELALVILRRRPELGLALVAAPLLLGNATLVEQVRRGLVPRDDTVDGPVLVGQSAQLVSDAVGFPTTWPASWIFAAQTGLSPGRYDRLAGRYLFYRQNNLGGLIDVGDEEGAMLGEGWGRPQRESGEAAPFRVTRGAARVLAPLDGPEDLELEVRAAAEAGTTLVGLRVNGRDAGRFAAGPGFASHRLRVPASFWRRELNDVTLVPEAPLRVSALQFRRTSEGR